MAIFAVEFDVSPPLTDVVRDRLIQIQSLAQLIEVADLEIGTEFYRATLWLELTEQES